MPMPLDERKRGSVVSVIMKKLHNSGNGYDELKEQNENMTHSKKMEDGAEVEYAQSGLEAASEEILNAIDKKSPKALISSLRSLVMMIVNEYDD